MGNLWRRGSANSMVDLKLFIGYDEKHEHYLETKKEKKKKNPWFFEKEKDKIRPEYFEKAAAKKKTSVNGLMLWLPRFNVAERK